MTSESQSATPVTLDPMELLGIRDNLIEAAEQAGAQCLGAGFGFGVADAMLTGRNEDASVTVSVYDTGSIDLTVYQSSEDEGVTTQFASEAEAEVALLEALKVLLEAA